MYIKKQLGFTLVEVMVVVTIVGVLAAVAFPAYHDYTTRSRVLEALSVGGGAQQRLLSDGVSGAVSLASLSTAWNAQSADTGANSKYVKSVLFNTAPVTGVITIALDAPATGLSAGSSTLVLSPYVRSGSAGTSVTLVAAQLSGDSGSLDWACASDSNNAATAQGLLGAALGTLPSKYAPAACR